MTNPFSAIWTAKGNKLCDGHWEIYYQSQPLNLSAEWRDNDMGTYGIYSFIFPDDDTFADGLPEDQWVAENVTWLVDMFVLNGIPCDETHMRWFYQAVNEHDWRCGSCGGCL